MAIENSTPNGEWVKAAHVNMMTDTIIANLPPEALRSIVRGLLGVDPKVTTAFHDFASKYLAGTKPTSTPKLFAQSSNNSRILPAFYEFRSRYRCLMGCGWGFETLQSLTDVIEQTQELGWHSLVDESKSFPDVLANIDSDLVQAVTAVQKELTTSAGMPSMNSAEVQTMDKLTSVLLDFKADAESFDCDFPFQRGLSRLEMLQGRRSSAAAHSQTRTTVQAFSSITSHLEMVNLGDASVPRVFMGLWQFSSPAWGTASRSKINGDFQKHVDAGLIAYGEHTHLYVDVKKFQKSTMVLNYIILDMADHYGDAEVTFVSCIYCLRHKNDD
jgi:hypothetical protein